MKRRLLALDTADDIPLKAGLIVVGRHPTCDFRIRSPRISRIHCCLHSSGDRIFVRDLNSTNGIRVNGSPVLQAELSPGDVLSIAQIHYKCVESEEESTETRVSEVSTPRREDRSREVRELPKIPAEEVPISMPLAADVHESSVEIRIRTGS